MDNICSICLISPIPELDLCTTNCGHTYCKGCLDIWMNRLKKECPICRQDIIYFMYNNNQIRPVFTRINNNHLIRMYRNLTISFKVLLLSSVLSVTSLLCLYLVKLEEYRALEKDYQINC